MKTMVILSLIFVGMLLAPIIFAGLYYKKRKGSVLHISQDKIRDARYFGKSFAAMVQGHIDAAVDGKILLSRQEPYVDADITETYEEVTEDMVIARHREFRPPQAARVFEKEIYSGKNAAILNEKTEIRAMYCDKKAILGNEISVVRWVDAGDTLAVYDRCNLGISASARNQLSIGHDCTFRRLYAPLIRIGQYPDSTLDPEEGRDPRIYYLPVQTNIENNVEYLHDEMINEDGFVDFSVLSSKDVTVTEDMIVQGDIRSHRGIHLCDNSVVCGNLFAEKDIRLGRNATVLGNIFTQGNIYFEERASAGQKGKICSVIARDDISFEKDNFVFGYVACEKYGSTMELPKEEEEELPPPVFQFLTTPAGLRHLFFKNLHDFEHVDHQGYRKAEKLTDAVIPEGAVKIQKSMFFDCEVLKKVVLPNTLTAIEDYAFADCFRLEGLGDFSQMPLLKIGTSAFENCRLLRELVLPASLLSLGGAAFAGCAGIQSVTVPEDSLLERVGDHCFRGCRLLEEIWFPDTVSYIGVSAFLDCEGLKFVSVPETCAGQAGIRELTERGVQVELRPLPEEDEEEAGIPDLPEDEGARIPDLPGGDETSALEIDEV